QGWISVYTAWLGRWACRAATYMQGAVSRPRAGALPITLPNGTGAVGRRWAWGLTATFWRWPCQAAICTLAATSPRQARAWPATLRSGTEAIGGRSVRQSTT